MIYEPSFKAKDSNPAKRKCLRCGNMFDSRDKNNRICPKCFIRNNAKAPYHYTGEDWSRQEIKARAWTEPYNPEVI